MLLAMAMFVLVVDTSLMNVSIAAVVDDFGTTVSGVQSAIALEGLLVGRPQDVEDEIIQINPDARPIALQVALLIPLLAGLIGFLNSFRGMRLPTPPVGPMRGHVDPIGPPRHEGVAELAHEELGSDGPPPFSLIARSKIGDSRSAAARSRAPVL